MSRSKKVIFRVSDAEGEMLAAIAAVLKRSQSDVIRLALQRLADITFGQKNLEPLLFTEDELCTVIDQVVRRLFLKMSKDRRE